ncbi:hypothetical protein C6Y14_10325 [Streptomyces dioscori]|uniref:LppX_LprAFG lipoprotein n=1 Tax=Streptomyces dioscori TaxID=2109333 RepID=A0A2P8QB73_9ACTN|nr:hypothetical protein [Streptomyces dioscori]PSM43500.1 hypothetical protein C6Y14_10325 [Streptomyces dioscori]
MAGKHVLGIATVLVLTAGLSACSSGDDGADGKKDGAKGASSTKGASESQVVRAAHQKTTAADSAKMSLVSEAAAAGETVTVRGTGVMDLEEGASTMTMTSKGQKIEQRVLDGVVYQKAPAEQRAQLQLPKGKTWMKIDPAKLGGAGGQVNDPAESFAYTEGVNDADVTKVGTETIDGTRTTHYRVKIAVKDLAKGDRAKADQLEKQLGTSTLPLEMWVDDEGRLRQQTIELTLRPQAGGGQKDQTVKSTTTLKFTDFGTEADVEAPPAADTVDVTKKLADASKAEATA